MIEKEYAEKKKIEKLVAIAASTAVLTTYFINNNQVKASSDLQISTVAENNNQILLNQTISAIMKLKNEINKNQLNIKNNLQQVETIEESIRNIQEKILKSRERENQLKEKLSSIEEKENEINNLIKNCQESIMAKKAELQALLNKKKNLQIKISELNEEESSVQKELEKKSQQLQELEQEYEQISDTEVSTVLLKKIDAVKFKQMKYQKNYDSAQVNLKVHRPLLEQREKEVELYTKKLAELKRNPEKNKKEISDYEDKLEDSSAHYKDETGWVSKAENMVKIYPAELKKLASQIEDLENKVNESSKNKKAKEDLNSKILNLKEEIQNQNEKRTDQVSKKNQLNRELSNLVAAKQNIDEVLSNLNKQFIKDSNSQKNLVDEKAAINDQVSEIINYQHKLATDLQTDQEKLKQINLNDQDLNDLEIKLENKIADLESKQTEIQQLMEKEKAELNKQREHERPTQPEKPHADLNDDKSKEKGQVEKERPLELPNNHEANEKSEQTEIIEIPATIVEPSTSSNKKAVLETHNTVFNKITKFVKKKHNKRKITQIKVAKGKIFVKINRKWQKISEKKLRVMLKGQIKASGKISVKRNKKKVFFLDSKGRRSKRQARFNKIYKINSFKINKKQVLVRVAKNSWVPMSKISFR